MGLLGALGFERLNSALFSIADVKPCRVSFKCANPSVFCFGLVKHGFSCFGCVNISLFHFEVVKPFVALSGFVNPHFEVVKPSRCRKTMDVVRFPYGVSAGLMFLSAEILLYSALMS